MKFRGISRNYPTRNSAEFRRNFSQFRTEYGIDGSKKNRRNSVSTEFRGHPRNDGKSISKTIGEGKLDRSWPTPSLESSGQFVRVFFWGTIFGVTGFFLSLFHSYTSTPTSPYNIPTLSGSFQDDQLSPRFLVQEKASFYRNCFLSIFTDKKYLPLAENMLQKWTKRFKM